MLLRNVPFYLIRLCVWLIFIPAGAIGYAQSNFVVSEIMPRPSKDGVEYLELYNASEGPLSLNGLEVTIVKDGKRSDVVKVRKNLSVPPNAFIVFTKDASALLGKHPQANADDILEVDLPRLADKGFQVELSYEGSLIDQVAYHKDDFPRGMKSKSGISLIRMIDAETNDSQWIPCSDSSGGDPTYGESPYRIVRGKDDDNSDTETKLSLEELKQIVVDRIEKEDQVCLCVYALTGEFIKGYKVDETYKWGKVPLSESISSLNLFPGRYYVLIAFFLDSQQEPLAAKIRS